MVFLYQQKHKKEMIDQNLVTEKSIFVNDKLLFLVEEKLVFSFQEGRVDNRLKI